MVYSNIGRGRKLQWNVDLHPGSTPLFLMCDRTGQWWRKDENPEQQFHGEGLIWIMQKEGFTMQAGDIPFQKPLWFKILLLDSLWDNLLTKQNKCISHFLKSPQISSPHQTPQNRRFCHVGEFWTCLERCLKDFLCFSLENYQGQPSPPMKRNLIKAVC